MDNAATNKKKKKINRIRSERLSLQGGAFLRYNEYNWIDATNHG